VFALSIIANASYAGRLPSDWTGSYSYQYVMGHASGAPAPAWVFNLIVKSDGSCELTWQGYQKDDDIICNASGKGDDLQVYYVNFANNETWDRSRSELYKPGEKLMELTRERRSGKLWTEWGALNKGGPLKDGARFERD
jgi:hypothetical protein